MPRGMHLSGVLMRALSFVPNSPASSQNSSYKDLNDIDALWGLS
jgi:hypothetical protein